ncbi:MAG: hypothetical protein NXI04_28365 [Planctomycetaceae bacterium]|nr:hypothetical protein [Planctomycetaceae bacterium]
MIRAAVFACALLVPATVAFPQAMPPTGPGATGEVAWCARYSLGSANGVYFYECWTFISGTGCEAPTGYGVMNFACTPACSPTQCDCQAGPGQGRNDETVTKDGERTRYTGWTYARGKIALERIQRAIDGRIGPSQSRRGGPAVTFGISNANRGNRGRAYERVDSSARSWSRYIRDFKESYDEAEGTAAEEMQQLDLLIKNGGFLDTIRGFAKRVSSAGRSVGNVRFWGEEGVPYVTSGAVTVPVSATTDAATSFSIDASAVLEDRSPTGWETIPAGDSLRSRIVELPDGTLFKLYQFRSGAGPDITVGTEVTEADDARRRVFRANVAERGSFKHVIRYRGDHYIVNTYTEFGDKRTCYARIEEIVAP